MANKRSVQTNAVPRKEEEAAPQNPAPQNPAPQNPAPQNPAPRKPAPSAPRPSVTPEYQAQLDKYGQAYQDARAKGDWLGMQAANTAANQIRNQNGLPASFATEDIRKVAQGSPVSGAYPGAGFTQREILQRGFDVGVKRGELAANEAVRRGEDELLRGEEKALEQLDVQRRRTDLDEAKALDNQALYAEARGDRGGVGQAQYGAIQAQAMANRQAIDKARTDLSTETSRRIADLRAQGEFKKADNLLQLTQNYLGQLAELSRWEAEYWMNERQFATQVSQWERQFAKDAERFDKQFAAQIGQMMGSYEGRPTFQAQQAELDRAMDLGMAMLNQGVRPTKEQAALMGLTEAQVNDYVNQVKLGMKLKYSRGGSGGGGASTEKPKPSPMYKDVMSTVKSILRDEGPDAAADYLDRMVQMGQLRDDEWYDLTTVLLGQEITPTVNHYVPEWEQTSYDRLDVGQGPISFNRLDELRRSGAISSDVYDEIMRTEGAYRK